MSEVLYRFKGDLERGEFVQGLPARDITAEDWEHLEEQARTDLQAQARSAGGLYDQVHTLEGKKAVVSKRKKGRDKKGEQVDPDPFLPPGSRTDADVIGSGAVPPADEPQGETAGGFTQADTGGSASSHLGAEAPKKSKGTKEE